MKIFRKIVVLFSLFIFGGASLVGAVCLKENKEIVIASESVQEAYFSMTEIETTGWCYFTVKGSTEIAEATDNTPIPDSIMNNENVNFLDKVAFKSYGEEVKLRDVLVANSFCWNHWTRTSCISFQIDPTLAANILSTMVSGQHDSNTIVIYENCVIPSPAFAAGAEEFSGYKQPTRAFFSISRDRSISAQIEIIKSAKICNILRKTDREGGLLKTCLWFGIDYASGYNETVANAKMEDVLTPYIFGNRVKIDGKYIGQYADGDNYTDGSIIVASHSNVWEWWGTN